VTKSSLKGYEYVPMAHAATAHQTPINTNEIPILNSACEWL